MNNAPLYLATGGCIVGVFSLLIAIVALARGNSARRLAGDVCREADQSFAEVARDFRRVKDDMDSLSGTQHRGRKDVEKLERRFETFEAHAQTCHEALQYRLNRNSALIDAHAADLSATLAASHAVPQPQWRPTTELTDEDNPLASIVIDPTGPNSIGISAADFDQQQAAAA